MPAFSCKDILSFFAQKQFIILLLTSINTNLCREYIPQYNQLSAASTSSTLSPDLVGFSGLFVVWSLVRDRTIPRRYRPRINHGGLLPHALVLCAPLPGLGSFFLGGDASRLVSWTGFVRTVEADRFRRTRTPADVGGGGHVLRLSTKTSHLAVWEGATRLGGCNDSLSDCATS